MPCAIDMQARCYSSCIVVDLELSDSESELSLSDTDDSSTDSQSITDHDDSEGLDDEGFTSELVMSKSETSISTLDQQYSIWSSLNWTTLLKYSLRKPSI